MSHNAGLKSGKLSSFQARETTAAAGVGWEILRYHCWRGGGRVLHRVLVQWCYARAVRIVRLLMAASGAHQTAAAKGPRRSGKPDQVPVEHNSGVDMCTYSNRTVNQSYLQLRLSKGKGDVGAPMYCTVQDVGIMVWPMVAEVMTRKG